MTMGMGNYSALVSPERELPRFAPSRVLAFCGLHQMHAPWQSIVKGLGLDRESGITMRDLDRYVNVHLMLTYGLPKGMSSDLVSPIRCPRCGKQITSVPCYRCCVIDGAWPSQTVDALTDLSDF